MASTTTDLMNGIWKERLSAHLGYLFTELRFLDRIYAAADHGFAAIEFPDAASHPILQLEKAISRANVAVAQTATSFGNIADGEKGLACLPGREDDFRESCEAALAAAKAVGCKAIHVMAGVLPHSVNPGAAANAYVKNLQWAVDLYERAETRTLIEVINSKDTPGYFMDTFERFFWAYERIGSPSVGLTFDTYHSCVIAGSAESPIRSLGSKVAHVQVADFSGRGEPGTGMIDFNSVARALNDIGYDGWIGCEYKPVNNTASGLSWRNNIPKAKVAVRD